MFYVVPGESLSMSILLLLQMNLSSIMMIRSLAKYLLLLLVCSFVRLLDPVVLVLTMSWTLLVFLPSSLVGHGICNYGIT